MAAASRAGTAGRLVSALKTRIVDDDRDFADRLENVPTLEGHEARPSDRFGRVPRL